MSIPIIWPQPQDYAIWIPINPRVKWWRQRGVFIHGLVLQA